MVEQLDSTEPKFSLSSLQAVMWNTILLMVWDYLKKT